MKAGLSDSEVKEVLELYKSKEIKDKLKSSTQNALDLGVSCPSVVLGDSGQRDETLLCKDLILSYCVFTGIRLSTCGVSCEWKARGVFWIRQI